MKPWSCQPCSRRVRSTFRNQTITSLGLSSLSLKHLLQKNSPRQRRSSPVDAWTITRLGETRDSLLGCFCTAISFFPLWEGVSDCVGGGFCVGIVGNGTGLDSWLEPFSGLKYCAFFRFSLFSCSTCSPLPCSNWESGLTFLAFFLLDEVVTSLLSDKADSRTECFLRLLSLGSGPSTTIVVFRDVGDIDKTVPITAGGWLSLGGFQKYNFPPAEKRPADEQWFNAATHVSLLL